MGKYQGKYIPYWVGRFLTSLNADKDYIVVVYEVYTSRRGV
jgi:hypothetical protein